MAEAGAHRNNRSTADNGKNSSKGSVRNNHNNVVPNKVPDPNRGRRQFPNSTRHASALHWGMPSPVRRVPHPRPLLLFATIAFSSLPLPDSNGVFDYMWAEREKIWQRVGRNQSFKAISDRWV